MNGYGEAKTSAFQAIRADATALARAAQEQLRAAQDRQFPDSDNRLEPKRSSEINDRLMLLDKAAQVLIEQVDLLTSKLSPVLRCYPPEGQASRPGPPPAETPLGNAVQHIADGMEVASRKLSDLYASVDF